MAEFKFYTSFTAKNGVNVSRGEACLVQDSGRLRTAHIVDIRNNLSAFYATFNVCARDENTIDPKTPPIRYEGSGFYHLSERGNSGINQNAKFFVTVKEGEEAAIALHAHMTGVSEGVMNPSLPVEVEVTEQPTPNTAPLPPASIIPPIETREQRRARLGKPEKPERQ